MRRAAALVASGAILAVAAVGPASAGPLSPQLRTERAYFHCVGTTPLGNVSLAAENMIPSWNLTEPAGSVTDGEGCGTLDLNPLVTTVEPQENPTDGVWRGTFTGNLNSLTAHLYDFVAVGTSRVDGAASISVRLKIDDEPITPNGGNDITAVETNSGLTFFYEFSVTDIGFIEPNPDLDGDGIGDNPYGSVEHTITLTVDGWAPDTNFLGFWVYDTTEVPAGITFNPETLAATVIPRG